MEFIIYIFIFIIGITLGSFFTLATYRIPLKQDITHERSYCPKCNHRLEFFDLIPVFSYIFLGGKCRYCKEKIHPRYLILELLSGIAFLIFTILLDFDIYNLELKKIILWFYGTIFISTLFIIGGILKEHKTLSKPVIFFGLLVEIIYIIYLYTLKVNVYKYVICLFCVFIVLLIEEMLLKKNKKINFIPNTIILLLYIIIGIM